MRANKVDIVWELLEGNALEKALRLLDKPDRFAFYAVKVGRKTVFAEDHGVVTLYVIGDDEYIYVDKCYCGLPKSVKTLNDVLAAAYAQEPILSDYRYRKKDP